MHPNIRSRRSTTGKQPFHFRDDDSTRRSLLLSMHRYGPSELVNSSGRRPRGLRPADRPKIGSMRSPLFFPLPQSVERQIDHGSRVKREHLRNDKPPNDGNTERFA